MATIYRIGISLWTMQFTAARPGLGRSLYRRFGEDAQLADADQAGLAKASAAADASPASIGAPRARRERWSGAEALVGRLREGRAAFGQDWACVVAPPPAAAAEIGSLVRPRVQLDALTPGLEGFWATERPWER